MPTGGALLVASSVLLAAGFGSRTSTGLGLGRWVCVGWAVCAAAASALNLGWPPARATVLLNPGGTLVPLALALFLLTSRPQEGRSKGLWRVGLAALATAALLVVGTAYGEQAGAPDVAAAIAGGGVALVATALGGDPRGSVTAAAAGLALSGLLLGLCAWAGWVPWPATLGGGPTFDAGVLGVIGTQVLDGIAATWRAQQLGPAPLRASPH